MKNSNPLMKAHLCLMIAMMCGTVGGAVHFIIECVRSTASNERLSNLTNIILMAVILSMLAMGVTYLIKGYSKEAAKFYKAFMLFHVGVCVLSIIVNVFFYKLTGLMAVICILTAFKALDLLIMTFGKDLGERKTWILFYVIIGFDIIALILAVINMMKIGFDFSFTGYVTALIADGTIGLSVRGKYSNKKSRGSS